MIHTAHKVDFSSFETKPHSDTLLQNDQGQIVLHHDCEGLPVDRLLNCEYIEVTSLETPQGTATEIIPNVVISIAHAHPTAPRSIQFRSERKYLLSDGFSVTYCRGLHATTTLPWSEGFLKPQAEIQLHGNKNVLSWLPPILKGVAR